MSDLVYAWLGGNCDLPRITESCEVCGAADRCRWWCLRRYGLLLWLAFSLAIGGAIVAFGRLVQ